MKGRVELLSEGKPVPISQTMARSYRSRCSASRSQALAKVHGKSPVDFSYEASGAGFETDRPTYTPNSGTVDVSTSWQRLYVAPSVRIPLFQRLQWMSLTPRIATREAFYTMRRPESLDPLETESGSFLYSAPFFEMEWIGPRMQRFYGVERAPGKRKYKQLIEPRIVWTYEPDLEDQAQILVFDGQDYVFSRPLDPEHPGRDLDRNLLFYGFTTRLWSKQVEEEGAPSRASSWELLSFDLTQSYALNYDQNRWQRQK